MPTEYKLKVNVADGQIREQMMRGNKLCLAFETGNGANVVAVASRGKLCFNIGLKQAKHMLMVITGFGEREEFTFKDEY